MTVLTKPVSEMKKKSALSEPLVAAEYPVAVGGVATDSEVVVVPSRKDGRKQYRDVENLTVSRNQARVSSVTTVCLSLIGFLVLSIGIVGGMYLYQQCARKPMQRLRGFLNIPYNNSEGKQLYYYSDSRASQRVATPDISSKKSGYFSEQFEASSGYERIDVPEFNGGRHGQFIHDFKINKTGIVDVDGKRCFVIPLDRNAVVFLPTFVIDLAHKLSSRGSDVKVIVKTMRVTFPALTDMINLGERIAQECSGMKIYSLVKANLGPVFKRSAEEPVVFGSFSGNTMKVEIVNYKEMEEAEKDSNGIVGA